MDSERLTESIRRIECDKNLSPQTKTASVRMVYSTYFQKNILHNIGSYPDRLEKKRSEIIECGTLYVMNQLLLYSRGGISSIVLSHQDLLTHLQYEFMREFGPNFQSNDMIEAIYRVLDVTYNVKTIKGEKNVTFEFKGFQ